MKEKKVALVTGGNKGIGLEVCRQLAASGIEVVLTARDELRGIQAQKELARDGLMVDFQRLDVTEPSTIRSAISFISEKHGFLNILVNNAGILCGEDGSGINVKTEIVRKVFETNTVGPLQISQLFLPLLKKREGGKIINISSGMGSLNEMGGGYAAYRISKTALNAVTLILSNELKELKISVNAVCPGWVNTDMGGKNAPRSIKQGASGIVRLALLENNIPTGKFLRDGKEIPW